MYGLMELEAVPEKRAHPMKSAPNGEGAFLSEVSAPTTPAGLPGDEELWLVLNDKPLRFALPADAEDTLDYRVLVFGLDPSSYRLDSSLGESLSGDGVTVPAGQQAELSVQLLHEPLHPRRFRVLITRPDGEGPGGRIVIQRLFRWIPQPTERHFGARIEPERLDIRPWTRRMRFQVRLTNESNVAVNATPVLQVETFFPTATGADAPLRCLNEGSCWGELPPYTERVWHCRARINPKALEKVARLVPSGQAVWSVANKSFRFWHKPTGE